MPDWTFPTAFSSWGPEERAAIERVLASGRLTMGAETEAFEAEYAAYHGRRHCIMVNSGSSANLVAVAALCHKEGGADRLRGEPAAVPAIAWATTYAPLVQHGLKPRVVDVDETWNAKPSDVADLLTELDYPLIVVGCSILGNPAYLVELADLAKRADAYLLNDDCESLGARIPSTDPAKPGEFRTTASYGDIATSSFFYSHQLSAIEGGAVLTDDDELARLCRLLRNHGNAGFLNKDASFAESYDFRLFGYNLRPLEMHAAIAREQLKKLDGFIAERQDNLERFYRLAVDYQLPITMPRWTTTALSPFSLNFTVESSDARAKLVAALRSHGIDCRLPTGGSFTRHAYGAPWRSQPTPNADRIHDTGLFLGCPPWPAEAEIDRAVKIMRSVL